MNSTRGLKDKNKLRVAYIGNFLPEHSTENDVRKAFEHLGHEVVKFQENTVLYIVPKDYDLILITSTWDNAIPLPYWLDIMKECADEGVPIATLHLDTFWSTSRNGRKWWQNPMFHTAYIFTADGDHEKEWELLGKNHIWLPPAVRYDAVYGGKFRTEYECDLAFVGSNGNGYHEDVWTYRKELLDQLREMSKRNGWKFRNPGGDDPKISRGKDMNDFYASAKVTVGDSLCLKKDYSKYWSDRVPEATGRGGLLIMPQINALNDIYESNLPMYEWGNWLQLEELIKIILHNPHDPLIIDQRIACQEITAAGHTYVNRVQKILEVVGL